METVFYNREGARAPIHRDTANSAEPSGATAWCGLSSSLGGTTWQKCDASKVSNRCLACFDAVASWCSLRSRLIVSAAGEPFCTLLGFTLLSFRREATSSSFTEGSYKYATPPVMPLPTLIPVGPKTKTTPLVMYSQQWSPAPSITAWTPLLRTPNLSPDCPAAKNLPDVAPYKHVLPMMTESLAWKTPFASASRGG